MRDLCEARVALSLTDGQHLLRAGSHGLVPEAPGCARTRVRGSL